MYFRVYIASRSVFAKLRTECAKVQSQPCLERAEAEVRLRLLSVDLAEQLQRPNGVRAVRNLGLRLQQTQVHTARFCFAVLLALFASA